jgi:hypothetical protein
MFFHNTYLCIVIVARLGIAIPEKAKWHFSDFDLTLDDWNPKDTPNPKSGEIQFSFREEPTRYNNTFTCYRRWKGKNLADAEVILPSGPRPWTLCGGVNSELYFRPRNISSSIPMVFEIDLVYLEKSSNLSVYQNRMLFD